MKQGQVRATSSWVVAGDQNKVAQSKTTHFSDFLFQLVWRPDRHPKWCMGLLGYCIPLKITKFTQFDLLFFSQRVKILSRRTLLHHEFSVRSSLCLTLLPPGELFWPPGGKWLFGRYCGVLHVHKQHMWALRISLLSHLIQDPQSSVSYQNIFSCVTTICLFFYCSDSCIVSLTVTERVWRMAYEMTIMRILTGHGL